MSKRSNEQSNDNGEFAGKKQATDRREEPDIPPITVNMPCPADKVASLIGKRGVVIQEIIRSSGCKIQIDQNFPEGHPRQVQLIGNPKSLSSAMTQITQIISSNPDTQKSQQWEPDFYIPNEKVGGIIGSRGCVINEIMRRSGCKIQIVQDGQPEGLDRLTTFEGTSEQIKEAKQLIEQVLQEGSVELMKNAPGGENSVPSSSGGGGATRSGNYAEDEIDPHKVKVVIGVKGTTVGLIVKKSGCKVQLNQKFPQGCMHRIEYTGTPAQIETARYLVNVVTTQGDDALHAALDGMANGTLPVDNFVMQEMNVFQSQMLQLMGTHGANVNDVQWRCSVKIDIDTTPVMLPQNNIGPNGLPEPCNKVTVVGTSEGVQMAVKLLYEFIGIHIEAPPTIAPAPAYGAPQYPPVQPYGALPAGYQQPPGYGAPPAAYGAPPAAYGAPPAYGAPAYGAPPLAYGASPQTYGAPAQHPYGVPQQAQPVYQPPVNMGQQQQTHEQRSGVKPATLALGQDGKAGELEAAVKLPDGSYQQVAVIKNNAIGRLQGRNSANIELIKNKSGAEVTVAPADNAKATTRVFLTGTSQMVALASQMVQEVLVNGVGKLQQMIDVPRAVSAVAPTVAQQLPTPGQAPYGMPASMGQHPAYNQYPPHASQNPGQVPGQFSPYGAPNPVPQYGAPPGALPQPYGQPSFPPAYGAPATNTMPPYGHPGAIPQYGQPPQQFVPPTFAQFAQPVQYNNGGRPQQQPGQNPFTQPGRGGYNTGGGGYQHGQQSKPYNRKY